MNIKKIVLSVFIILAVFLIVGCEGDAKKEEASTEVKGAYNIPAGFVYDEKYKDFDFASDTKETVVKKYGKPQKIETVGTTTAYQGGEIQHYFYDGFKVVFFNEKISSVFIKDTSYSTSKTIKIGSSKKDVEAAYGISSTSAYRDYDQYMVMKFKYDSSDTVSEILLGSFFD